MSSKKVLRLSPESTNGLEPCSFVPAEAVIDGKPIELGASFCSSSDQKFHVGVWQSTAYAEDLGEAGYPADEFCVVLSGSASLTDEAGKSEVFSAGDCYFVPKGFKGSFRVIETMRKYYVIYEG